jgi:hypothetical protein
MPAEVGNGAETPVRHLSSVFNAVKRSAQLSVVAAELSPANEAIRLGAFTAGEVYAHSPLMGAATLGLSTLAIEGVAALSTASLLTTQTNERINDFLRTRLEKRGYNPTQNMSAVTKGTATFLGGSVVGMSLDKFDKPNMTTAEVRKSGLIKSAWLAGALAVVGAAGGDTAPRVFEYVVHNPRVDALVAASVGLVALGRKITNTIREPSVMTVAESISEGTVWYDKDKYGNVYGIIKDAEQLQKAAILEQDVWTEKGYGDLEAEGYHSHIERSRTFATFNESECTGVSRMFIGNETMLPPFLTFEYPENMGGGEVPYFDENDREALAKAARNGELEELGTIAIRKELRGKGVDLRLERIAYRDARARGIKKWGIIMEPRRVEKMNKNHGFTFRQLTETVPYQGGDCAAFVMDLEEVNQTMKKQHPLEHFWFVGKKISA